MSRIALFLNGLAPKKLPQLKQFDKIYCTDGAYNYLKKLGVKVDVVSGDFDSIDPDEVSSETEVVKTMDQDFTDFEKALQLIKERNFKEVYVYGSSGMEHDHFLGNLSTGLKFKDDLALVFFDDYSYFFFADKSTTLDNYKGRIISLYPFPFTKGISTKGLKYSLNNEDLDLTERIGIRNQAIEDQVIIEFKEGNLLVFIKMDK